MKTETFQGKNCFYAADRQAWRAWLSANGDKEKNVLLIMHRKDSTIQGINYEDAILEALCFGWIDSKANKRDAESTYLQFIPRNPKSNWSAINKVRVAGLMEQGLMTPAGQATIDLAKKTGTWDALNDIDKGILPADLQGAFDLNKKAFDHFQAFPPSSKHIILQWILNAKKEETRQGRIKIVVDMAERNERANHPKPK